MNDQAHPFEQRQSPQDYFRTVMHTVVGQAFEAAGYSLQHEPLRWSGGRFRYRKSLADGLYAFISFQVLIYNDTTWSGRNPSRFRVTLICSDQATGAKTAHPRYQQRTLSQLVVGDFGVKILPAIDHWWQFTDTDSLGKALAEAGHLLIAYAIPYLDGDLSPQTDD